MSEKSKLASDIQPFKSRWRLNWPFWGLVVGAPERRSLMRLFQPNQRPPGGLCLSSYTQLSCKRPTATQHTDQKTRSAAASRSARRMNVSRLPRALLEILIDGNNFHVYGLVRQETPCSRAVAMSRGPSEVSVGAVLRSRHIRIGHPRKRPSRFCDREKHIPYVDCPFTCASAARNAR